MTSISIPRCLLGLIGLAVFGPLTSLAQTPAQPPRKATRPPVEKRKFTSEAVEKEIVRVTGAIADPDLAWMFQACYPNTLDTTVNFSTAGGKPDTFIITGDINAMWLRDSCAQVQGYLPLCKEGRASGGNDRRADPPADGLHPDRSLRQRVPKRREQAQPARARPHRHAARAFSSAIGSWTRSATASVWTISTGKSPATPRRSTRIGGKRCAWPRPPCANNSARTATAPIDSRAGWPTPGWGPPIKPTGMICTAFRASDDPCKYLFNIPDNLFAVTSLGQLAEMTDALKPGDGLGAECRALAAEVQKGIEDFGIVNDPKYGKMYAYECDGLGNYLLMEDAGLPGLVSIPYFTPSLAGNPLVLASRAFAFSDDDPFWCRGIAAEGTGSPHGAAHNKGQGLDLAARDHLARALTSTDDGGDHEMPGHAEELHRGHRLHARVVQQGRSHAIHAPLVCLGQQPLRRVDHQSAKGTAEVARQADSARVLTVSRVAAHLLSRTGGGLETRLVT